jgi:glycosyltransferase involved in cell wall biosynthesis
MEPLINIITRTSNRPNNFQKTLSSIRQQTYKNINHIVCTDDVESIHYVINSGIKSFLFLNKENLISNDKNPNPNTGPYSPHNLYFNEVHKYIKDGWVIYLDDDDRFVDSFSLENVVKLINNNDEDTLIIWRMIYSNGSFLPLDVSPSRPPRIGGIGGSCFTFHSKYINIATWDSWKCSDFRVIDRLYKQIPKNIFSTEPIIFVPSAGFGLKKDI